MADLLEVVRLTVGVNIDGQRTKLIEDVNFRVAGSRRSSSRSLGSWARALPEIMERFVSRGRT